LGEYVGKLSQISRDYNLWIVVISNQYRGSAEKVVEELFRHLANEIGPGAVISEMIRDGVVEAEQKFRVSVSDPRPVFIITQKHPSEWTEDDEALKIPLGSIREPDRLRDFLFVLARLIRSNDFGAAKWEWRKEQVIQSAKIYGPVVVSLISPFVKGA
jgi:hypothetical protein